MKARGGVGGDRAHGGGCGGWEEGGEKGADYGDVGWGREWWEGRVSIGHGRRGVGGGVRGWGIWGGDWGEGGGGGRWAEDRSRTCCRRVV